MRKKKSSLIKREGVLTRKSELPEEKKNGVLGNSPPPRAMAIISIMNIANEPTTVQKIH